SVLEELPTTIARIPESLAEDPDRRLPAPDFSSWEKTRVHPSRLVDDVLLGEATRIDPSPFAAPAPKEDVLESARTGRVVKEFGVNRRPEVDRHREAYRPDRNRNESLASMDLRIASEIPSIPSPSHGASLKEREGPRPIEGSNPPEFLARSGVFSGGYR